MSLTVLSLWQPYASLVISGDKLFETRGWPCPAGMIGQWIGIAATKTIKREQNELFANRTFQKHLRNSCVAGLALKEFPAGAILGIARIQYCEPITPKFMRQVGAAERWFGDWKPGRYAWRLRDPIPFVAPIEARGNQGFWTYHGELPEYATDQTRSGDRCLAV